MISDCLVGLGSSIRRLASTAASTVRTAVVADNRFAKLEPKKMQEESKRTGVLAFKRGMMSHYDKWGYRHPVTVLDLANCQVLGSFPVGEAVIQEVGVGEKSPRQCHHAQLNYYASLKIAPKLVKVGFSVTPDALLPPGTFLRSAHFVPGQLVDVQAKSIGKGFQGAMKKWGFAGMSASHGNSLTHRAIGSTGGRSDPGRVFKGKKMSGRMGGYSVTAARLRILKIDHALNVVYVRGAVPGHENTVVRITDAKSLKRELWKAKDAEALPFPTYIPDPQVPLPRTQTAEFFDKDPLFVGSSTDK